MTLAEYIRQSGSRETAAHKIGVTLGTVTRWIRGDCSPSPMAMSRLTELGIEFR